VSYEIDPYFKDATKVIEVYTLQGVLISATPVKELTGSQEIYMESLPTGTYVVLLKAGDRKLHRALLIKK
jgi:hypothetical protein